MKIFIILMNISKIYRIHPKKITTTILTTSLILMFLLSTQNVLGFQDNWTGAIKSVDIVIFDFGWPPNQDGLYINLSYGGTTTNGYYKFIVYYEVTDVDGDDVDDEHVIFQTKWYYGALSGGGGGGGGGGVPMSVIKFHHLLMPEWRPTDGEEGEPIYATVGTGVFGVSFSLMRLFGWNVSRVYSSNSIGPVVYLNQTTGWLNCTDYGYRNGANEIFSDPNINSNGIIWGIKLYLKVKIIVDDNDIPGGNGGSYAWNYPAGLLVY